MFKRKAKDLDQPVTIRDFQEFTDFLVENVAMKKDIDAVETRLENKITEFKSDILDKVDAVFHEVKAMREEQSFKVGRDDRQDEEIVGIKERTSRLEARAGIS